ncbi:MAG: hypothetical protein OEZ58_16845 [Gammaproteobacteria bacterium]|nr:hypothetical protein [Gammaproteobacteria bacterium]
MYKELKTILDRETCFAKQVLLKNNWPITNKEIIKKLGIKQPENHYISSAVNILLRESAIRSLLKENKPEQAVVAMYKLCGALSDFQIYHNVETQNFAPIIPSLVYKSLEIGQRKSNNMKKVQEEVHGTPSQKKARWAEQRICYEQLKSKHPNWSHNQCCKEVAKKLGNVTYKTVGTTIEKNR